MKLKQGNRQLERDQMDNFDNLELKWELQDIKKILKEILKEIKKPEIPLPTGTKNLSACDYNRDMFGSCKHSDVVKCEGKCS